MAKVFLAIDVSLAVLINNITAGGPYIALSFLSRITDTTALGTPTPFTTILYLASPPNLTLCDYDTNLPSNPIRTFLQ